MPHRTLLQITTANGGWIPPLAIGVVCLIFYLFVFSPNLREQKRTQALIKNIKKGDPVVTIGGIHGVVSVVREHSLVIKVNEHGTLEVSRSAIARINDRRGVSNPKTDCDSKPGVPLTGVDKEIAR